MAPKTQIQIKVNDWGKYGSSLKYEAMKLIIFQSLILKDAKMQDGSFPRPFRYVVKSHCPRPIYRKLVLQKCYESYCLILSPDRTFHNPKALKPADQRLKKIIK